VSFQIPRYVVGGKADCPTWRDKGVETVQLMLQGSRPLSTATILPAQGHHQLGSATAPWPPSAHHSMSLSSDDVPHKGRITIKLCYCRHVLKQTSHYAHLPVRGHETDRTRTCKANSPSMKVTWPPQCTFYESSHCRTECVILWGLGPMVNAVHYILSCGWRCLVSRVNSQVLYGRASILA